MIMLDDSLSEHPEFYWLLLHPEAYSILFFPTQCPVEKNAFSPIFINA